MSELSSVRDISDKFIACILITIVFLGLIIRFFYFPYDIPINLDASAYFSYAYEMGKSGEFPKGFSLANNGWPTFLSIFFSVIKTGEFQTFVDLQRGVSIVISVLTVFPMYILCRKFFPKFIALIGSGLLVLEPRIITNSILGITEPLFNILIISSLAVFFSKKNWIYLSFALLACATIVRYESFLIIIPFSIMFFVKSKKDDRKIFKYFLCLGIFILILLPMMMIRIETMGQDGILSHISTAINAVSDHAIQGIPHDHPDVIDFPGEKNEFRLHNFLGVGFSNMFFSLGIIQIPIFIFFFPIGMFYLLRKNIIKKIDYRHITLILIIIFTSLYILYSHGRGIQEIRYYFILYPIIILVCSFGIEKIRGRIRDRTLLISVFLFVIILTCTYLEYDKINYAFEREAFEITSRSLEIVNKINSGSLHGSYITTASMIKDWPELDRPKEAKDRKISPFIKCVTDKGSTTVLPDDRDPVKCTKSSDSLEDFIKSNKENGLDHIVVDQFDREPNFIQDIFDNEEKHQYLEKVFDSRKEGYDYHVKIFWINFEKFEGNDL